MGIWKSVYEEVSRVELDGHIRLRIRTEVTFVFNLNNTKTAFKDVLICPFENLCIPDGILRNF